MSSGHIFPPRDHDERVKDIIAAGGGVDVDSSDIGYAFREACALLSGETAAWALTKSVDDVWDHYKAFSGILDTSEPFTVDTILPTFLTEDGASFLTKQDGKALLLEEDLFGMNTLLLDFAGSDGGQDLTDLSNQGHVDTFRGTCDIDTSLQFLGVNSLNSTGNANAVNFPFSESLSFGTGDFTIECGMRWTGSIGPWASPMGGSWSANSFGWYLLFQSSGTNMRFNNGNTILMQETFAPVVDVWYHIAVCRKGTDLRMFINGVQTGSTTTDSTDILGDPSRLIRLMEFDENTNAFTGNLGAVRISQGHAYYTENFTPPTSFYPTS